MNRACDALNRETFKISFYKKKIMRIKKVKVKKVFHLDFDKRDHRKWCKQYFNGNHYSFYLKIAEINPDESNIRSDST